MSKTLNDRTLALAGLFQAVYLVNQVARRGMVDTLQFETSINSLFVTDPKTTLEVYSDTVQNLRQGFIVLRNQLGGDSSKREVELTRYMIALLHLERKLAKRKALLNTISEGLERTSRQAEHFSITHANVIASLADIYANTISTLNPRIMVTGEHGHLQNPDNANKVRALLLAGMRSAVLWRQSGGNRLQLLFQRRGILAEAERLLGLSAH
jgi:high frequency lysogenization protein